MRIAYLILCHKNPKQVNLLLQELLCDGDCYVHIDKKSLMTKEDLITSERVFYVSDVKRVNVRWTCNSMVRATLELVELLVESGKHYDYVCLLSGQDFPIKGKEERNRFFKNNNGFNFIEVLSYDDKIVKRFNKRSLLYYPDYMFKGTFISKAVRKLYILATGGYTRTMGVLKRKNTSGLNFEYGSQWWCLTFECVLWMREYIKEHVNVDYFDHALTPDECFFQSVFMTSPFKDKRKELIVYLEWAENRNNPRILKTEDYGLLQTQKDKLFARKFDINTDNKILEMLAEK